LCPLDPGRRRGRRREPYEGLGQRGIVLQDRMRRPDDSAQRGPTAATAADLVALVGMHDWTDPTLPPIAEEWGLSVFSPDALRSVSSPLLEWLADTGASKAAIHFDVDTIDANEIRLGLGADLGGLTSTQARRVDINSVADVVALTIAEFIPRQVMHLQQLLAGFPLLSGET
jgi:arginase